MLNPVAAGFNLPHHNGGLPARRAAWALAPKPRNTNLGAKAHAVRVLKTGRFTEALFPAVTPSSLPPLCLSRSAPVTLRTRRASRAPRPSSRAPARRQRSRPGHRRQGSSRAGHPGAPGRSTSEHIADSAAPSSLLFHAKGRPPAHSIDNFSRTILECSCSSGALRQWMKSATGPQVEVMLSSNSCSGKKSHLPTPAVQSRRQSTPRENAQGGRLRCSTQAPGPALN